MPLPSCPPRRACLCSEPQGYQLAHEPEQLCGAGNSWGNACLHLQTMLPAKTTVCALRPPDALGGGLSAPATGHSEMRAQIHPPPSTEVQSRIPKRPCWQPELAWVCLVLTLSSNPKYLVVSVSSRVLLVTEPQGLSCPPNAQQ